MSCVGYSRSERRQRGFTLVEVLLVVAILGVLLTIAIPTFLGTKSLAADRSAQSSLRIALTNAKALAAGTDSYAPVTNAALSASEKSLQFTGSPSTGPAVVSMRSGSSGIVFAARSQSGICYLVGDAANAAGTVFRNLGTATCTAVPITSLPSVIPTQVRALPGGGWARSW